MIFARRVARLESNLAGLSSLVVALSGGVDSAALLGVAARVLKGRVRAVTTSSEAVPWEEIAAGRELSRQLGVAHAVLRTRELDDPDYRENRGDRCYFCRREMYGRLRAWAAARGIESVADGLQSDDAVADRPGVVAAREHGVLHPLRDAGLNKADVRRLARGLGLAVHDKPASPCLASRMPVGVAVSADRLRLVQRAERALKDAGYRIVRVRCEETHARIEVGPSELKRASRERERLIAGAIEAGFVTAELDPVGYRVPRAPSFGRK